MFGKRVVRALNVIIKWIAKDRTTMEMVNVNDINHVIKSLNRLPNWKKMIGEDKFTSVELDIKEQFTNLDKKECLEALSWILNEISKKMDGKEFIVLVMKRKSDKVSD